MSATIELDGQTLTITLQLQKPVRSTSGKSLVVATTRGTITTEARYAKKRIMVTANAFIYPNKKLKHRAARPETQKAAGNST
jgi:hypothetical protein